MCVYSTGEMYGSVFYCLQQNDIMNNSTSDHTSPDLKSRIRETESIIHVHMSDFVLVNLNVKVCVWMCVCLGVIVHFDVHL